jgi:hypothetical protein
MRYEKFVRHHGFVGLHLTEKALARIGGREAIEAALRKGAVSAIVNTMESRYGGGRAYSAAENDAMARSMYSQFWRVSLGVEEPPEHWGWSSPEGE